MSVWINEPLVVVVVVVDDVVVGLDGRVGLGAAVVDFGTEERQNRGFMFIKKEYQYSLQLSLVIVLYCKQIELIRRPTFTLGVLGPVAVFLYVAPVQAGRTALHVPRGTIAMQVRIAVSRY